MTLAALNRVDAQAAADRHEAALTAAYAKVLRDAGRKAAQRFRALSPITAAARQPDWTPPNIDELVDLALIAGQTAKKTAPVHAAALASVQTAYGAAGIAFDVTNPKALGLLAKTGGRSGDVAASVRDDLQKIIGDAYTAGLSVEKTAASIIQLSDQFSVAQSRMLARTDLNGIANGGSVLAAQEVGVGYKTWLCLAPNTRVRGLPIRVARRPADSFLVHLRAVASGGLTDSAELDRDLTVTPNHAILTGRGWIQAKFIEPGDRIFCCPSLDGEQTIVEPDVQDAPPMIAEVFAAASQTCATERMMGVVMNLDGEWERCEVEVVAVDGELRDRVAAELGEPSAQVLFATSDVGLTQTLADSALDAMLVGQGDADSFDLALASSGERVVSVKFPAENPSLGLSADRHALESKDSLDRALTRANRSTDVAQRFPGLVTSLDVVSVEIIPGTGYVYDLETESGWLLGNGMIVHNSASDDLVRPTHQDADGQTVPIDQPFDVGGEALDYPGDPAGSDAECCNCRCTVIYEDSLSGEDAVAASLTPTTEGTMKHDAQITLPLSLSFSVGAATTTNLALSRKALDEARGFTAEDAPTPEELEAALTAAINTVRWRAVLCVEGTPTEDGRLLEPGAISWRQLPLTLLAQTETQPGHDGAEVCGRIDRIWREGANIMGEGIFDGGPVGMETARMVSEQVLRGVSIDLAVLGYEMRPVMDAVPLDSGDGLALPMDEPDQLFVVTDGVIGAATICAFQAIADATIEVLTSAGSRALVTVTTPFVNLDALTAAAAPIHPPADWFENPELDKPTLLTVTPEGRVFGHVAPWRGCHTGYAGRCVPPPRSRTGYSGFHVGRIHLDDGSLISVGRLTLATGHAETVGMTTTAARAHYDNTGTVAAFVRAGEDEYGIWIAGALRSEAPPAMIQDLLANPLSGDWRNGEMIAAHAVPVPGFPILQASVLGPEGEEEQVLILTSTIGLEETPPVDFAARSRVLAARARGGLAALAELAHA